MLEITNTCSVGSLTIPLIYVYRNVKKCTALLGKYIALSEHEDSTDAWFCCLELFMRWRVADAHMYCLICSQEHYVETASVTWSH